MYSCKGTVTTSNSVTSIKTHYPITTTVLDYENKCKRKTEHEHTHVQTSRRVHTSRHVIIMYTDLNTQTVVSSMSVRSVSREDNKKIWCVRGGGRRYWGPLTIDKR